MISKITFVIYLYLVLFLCAKTVVVSIYYQLINEYKNENIGDCNETLFLRNLIIKVLQSSFQI